MKVQTPPVPTDAPVRAGSEDRRDAGFTLLELLIVTVILSILALMVAGPVGRAREKAMLAATRAEMRNLIHAAELFRADGWTLPSSVEELTSVGYSIGSDMTVCEFVRNPAAAGVEEHIRVQLKHRGTSSAITTEYPLWSGTMQETEAAGACVGGDGGGGPPGQGGTPPGQGGTPPGQGGN